MKTNEELNAEIERLKAALVFYRDGWTFKPSKFGGLTWKPNEKLLDDCGNTACEALDFKSSGIAPLPRQT